MIVCLIRFNNNGILCKSVVLAESVKEAEELLIKEYKKYDIEIQIEDYEVIEEEGIVLTWNEPTVSA